MSATSGLPSTTLELLGARLQRIDYALHGNTESSSPPTPTSPTTSATATARLRTLERQLQTLLSRSRTAREVLHLQQTHPELFRDDTAPPPALPPSSLAVAVLANAQLYTRVAAQLGTLKDSAVPDSAAFARLVELQPRLERAAVRQEEQAREVAELRARSAVAVEHWYEEGVLGMGERWAEWEERMRDCEIVVRRMEGAKKREEGVV